MLILPPKFESKIGSKEPENRQKHKSTTDSKPNLVQTPEIEDHQQTLSHWIKYGVQFHLSAQ